MLKGAFHAFLMPFILKANTIFIPREDASSPCEWIVVRVGRCVMCQSLLVGHIKGRSQIVGNHLFAHTPEKCMSIDRSTDALSPCSGVRKPLFTQIYVVCWKGKKITLSLWTGAHTRALKALPFAQCRMTDGLFFALFLLSLSLSLEIQWFLHSLNFYIQLHKSVAMKQTHVAAH